MEKIKIENLNFKYPGAAKNALSDINIEIKDGEFFLLCGKSGCGKSTLLRMIKPMLAPEGEKRGRITIFGKDSALLSDEEQSVKIGFITQNPDNQIVCDKVWHELAFGLENLGISSGEIRAKVAEMAAFFGIHKWFHRKTSELSGGEKQLLNLAGVMVMQPEILILDEPTSRLDPIASHNFLQTVLRINKEMGITVILSEHSLEEAFCMADKVAVLENGRIFAFGTAENVAFKLYDEKKPMEEALPVPAKAFFSVNSEGKCPLTVRDGRKWLSKTKIRKPVFETKSVKKSGLALEFKDLRMRYERDGEDILRGASGRIYEGELYAILGGNGAGKSTLLSCLAGVSVPYGGNIRVADEKRVVLLPQEPQTLFAHKSVYLDLLYMAKKTGYNDEKADIAVRKTLDFCDIGELADRHPYDLSGGEQQRAALAMALLCKPDILLLDEPTKGLDVYFKKKLASKFTGLLNRGMTIVMVSHDIEFCAEFADRCAMFFDGKIVSEGVPREFFSGKAFYTTAAARMSRGIVEGAVLEEDIEKALGVKKDNEKNQADKSSEFSLPEKKIKEKKNKKIKPVNIIMGAVFAAAFLFIHLKLCGNFDNKFEYMWEALSVIMLFLALLNFIPKHDFSVSKAAKTEKHTDKKRIAAAFATALLSAATVLFGVYFLGDRKYYFISVMLIIESMIPFAILFEQKKPKARELVIIAVLCAAAVGGRAAFAFLPQFKPVTAIIIVTAVCFGGETAFMVGAITGFVSNFYFSQGPWTPWQMFAFGTVGLVTGFFIQSGLLRKNKSDLCLFGFFATLIIYGGIMNPASVLMMQPYPTFKIIMYAYLSGLPCDLVHAMSTVFFLWFGAEPLCEKLERVKIKYGL